jgi:peptidyl-prolyl cis-trans isomerase-like 1
MLHRATFSIHCECLSNIEFFITLGPTQWLDGKHTIFGRIAKGMKVVANMGMVKTDVRDRPTEKVNIRQAFAMDAEGRPVQHTS